MKYQRVEDYPLRRYTSHAIESARTDGAGGSSSSTTWQRSSSARLATLAHLSTLDSDPLDVSNDPVDTPVDGESGRRDYDAATTLGPLSIRIYHGWRGRQLRRSGSQS